MFELKKALCILITVILAFAAVIPSFASQASEDSAFGAYKHVYIIGIDGAGRFVKDTDTPNFDRIFADGATDYTARAEIKTDSAPNWGAILTGASIIKTGLKNSVTSDNIRTSDTEFPTIFTYARKAFPDCELASIVNWNNINSGIIENDIGVNKQTGGTDADVVDLITEYFDAGNTPTVFYVQLDEIDHVGHNLGSADDEYYEQITKTDENVGKIYDAIERNGLLEDSLFIVAADHGHTNLGGHGGITMRETQVTLAVAGKGIKKGGTFDSDTRSRDIAAIALYALGIERPDNISARIPANVFENVEGLLSYEKGKTYSEILQLFS